jgi:hypothetical protein
MKEEISVYFRIAFEGRALRGKIQAPHGWEAENAPHLERLQRGKGAASFPKVWTRLKASVSRN